MLGLPLKAEHTTTAIAIAQAVPQPVPKNRLGASPQPGNAIMWLQELVCYPARAGFPELPPDPWLKESGWGGSEPKCHIVSTPIEAITMH